MTQLAYKFNPAGHEMPEGRRKYSEPDKRLSQIFEKWLDESRNFNFGKNYDRAEKQLKGIEATVEQAHALIIKYQDHPQIKESGEFVSAIYNKAPEKVIVYDLGIPINQIAYRLAGKTFVNNGKTGENTGRRAQGNIINNGTTSYNLGKMTTGNIINNGETCVSMGEKAEGNIINNGTAGAELGSGAKGNIINNGTAGKDTGEDARGNIVCNGITPGFTGTGARGKIIDLEHADGKNFYIKWNFWGIKRTIPISKPELKQYLDNLKLQLTNPNMDEVLQVLDGLTKKKLDKDITDILKRAG